MTKTYRDRVAAFFTAHPHHWIDATVLEGIGGRQAWRTRVSECRTELGMSIENRVRKVYRAQVIRLSEYRYVPAEASVPSEAHNVNEPSAGRLI